MRNVPMLISPPPPLFLPPFSVSLEMRGCRRLIWRSSVPASCPVRGQTMGQMALLAQHYK
jgi:hypothetical protein